jgi:hypothetical protein
VRTKDTGTLQYDIYFNNDQSECIVRCGVRAHEDPGQEPAGPGLNVLAATISTLVGAPVIAATRLRGGNAASSRSGASFATVPVTAARAAGCTGILVLRADSPFYSAAFTRASRPAGPSGAAQRSRAGHGEHCGGGVSAT